MKVVAKINEDTVLCEVSRDEITLLSGHFSTSERGFTINRYMEVGSELQLRKIATTSRFIRTTSKEKLKLLHEELQTLLISVDKAIDTVDSLNLFTNLSEEEPFK